MAKATQFLRFEDDSGHLVIEGECFDQKHLKEIDVIGWNWGVNDPTAPSKSSKAGAGSTKAAERPKNGLAKTRGERESDTDLKPKLLGFQKFTDKSTTRLLQAMDDGTAIYKAILTIEERFVRTQAEEEAESFEMKVELRDVLVVSFKWGGQAEDAGVSFHEDWELNYSTIEFAYKRRNNQGWIHQQFKQTPDSADSSMKSPPTPGEQHEVSDAQIADYLRRHPQRK